MNHLVDQRFRAYQVLCGGILRMVFILFSCHSFGIPINEIQRILINKELAINFQATSKKRSH